MLPDTRLDYKISLLKEFGLFAGSLGPCGHSDNSNNPQQGYNEESAGFTFPSRPQTMAGAWYAANLPHL